MRTLIVSLFLSAGAAQAWAQSATLTTDRPVYTTGGTDPVTITVKNNTAQSVELPAQLFTVWKGSTLVFEEGWATVQTPAVGPGGSKSWLWSKKNLSGNLLGAGTYTIKVGPLYFGSASVSLSLNIALTPTGKLAGTSRFPLATGNEWVYSVEQYLLASPPPPTTESMKILQAWSAYNLAYVKNFLGADRWVWMTGYSKPVLHVWAAPWGSMEALFRFNRPVGYTYSAPSLFAAGTKMRVGWTNDTVTTPAGTFKGCYRLDTVNPQTAPTGAAYHSYWFAPGIGLVQSLSGSYMKNTYRRLLRATLKGSDGKTYFIGQ